MVWQQAFHAFSREASISQNVHKGITVNTIFSNFSKLLENDESIELRVTKKKGTLEVLIVPAVRNAEESTGDDEISKIRSALTIPLIMRGSAEALEHDFWGQFSGYAGLRLNLQDSLNTLESLKESSKSDKNADNTAKGKAPVAPQADKKASEASEKKSNQAEKPADDLNLF